MRFQVNLNLSSPFLHRPTDNNWSNAALRIQTGENVPNLSLKPRIWLTYSVVFRQKLNGYLEDEMI